MNAQNDLPLFDAIAIQTNSCCNLRCKFCLYGQYPDYNSEEIISTDVVNTIFAQLAALEYRGRISLYNLNEPLTDPRIVELLQQAHQSLPDAFHFFSTNGLLLTQELLDTIVACTDHVRINQYSRLPDLDYDDKKIDLRDKHNFFALANSNRGGNLRGLPSAGTIGQGACANPFGQLVIMPPGVAVLCCADGFRQVVLGDVRHQTLEEIWYGPAFQSVREKLAANQRHKIPLCKQCNIEKGCFYEYYLHPSYYDDLIQDYAMTLNDAIK